MEIVTEEAWVGASLATFRLLKMVVGQKAILHVQGCVTVFDIISRIEFESWVTVAQIIAIIEGEPNCVNVIESDLHQ